MDPLHSSKLLKYNDTLDTSGDLHPSEATESSQNHQNPMNILVFVNIFVYG